MFLEKLPIKKSPPINIEGDFKLFVYILI